MAYAWPDGLPFASMRDHFSQDQTSAPPLKTDMNSGTTRRRNKYVVDITVQKVAIPMTSDQYLSFDYWYRHIIQKSSNFAMQVWNGSAYVTRTAVIDGSPVVTPRGASGSLVALTLWIENLA